jgi:hypothetical protein
MPATAAKRSARTLHCTWASNEGQAMHPIRIDRTETCEAHCREGDFDMTAGPYPLLTISAVLNLAALHSMATGHTVGEIIRSELSVHTTG